MPVRPAPAWDAARRSPRAFGPAGARPAARVVPGAVSGRSAAWGDAAADAALVRAARAGDRDAFGRLVRRHLEAAHGAALAVVRDAADAEDVCQDAFVAAIERLDDCRPEEKFRGWLLVIVRNRALDLLRRQHVRRAESLDAEPQSRSPEVAALATREPAPDVAAERADARAQLAAALETLTDTRREVLLLHDVEGWTHREIAAHLGLAEGTVRAHLFWARRALRDRLSDDFRREP